MMPSISLERFRSDPYSLYTELNIQEKYGTIASPMPMMGKWAHAITRYDDVSALLKDSRISNNPAMSVNGLNYNAWWVPSFYKALMSNIVSADMPDHTRLRNLVHKAFTPKMVRDLDAKIISITQDLLDKLELMDGPVDLLQEFALPLPLVVISEMMGVPAENRERFHQLSSSFLAEPGGGRLGVLSQIPMFFGLQRFMKNLVRSKQKNPQDDLTTALVQAEQDGDRLSENELIAMLFVLLLAGHETTVNLISSGTLALLESRDQFELLCKNPELIDTAVEELLRFTNPVQHGTPRFIKEDFVFNGTQMRKGEMVLLFFAGANWDERIFENPGRLDITRESNKHLSFGHGHHYCVGAPLARLEARRAFTMLLERFPDMQLAVPAEELKWRTTAFVRGLDSLPILLRG